MRTSRKYGLIIAILFVGAILLKNEIYVNRQDSPITSYNNSAVQAKFQTVGFDTATAITIVNACTTVKRGENGFITLKGNSNESFTIKTSFVKGDEIINVRKKVTADEKGNVTFSWKVSKETVPGTYPVIISNETSSIKLSHKVI